jgi:soluble lytic murein transglycosylase
MTLSIIHKHVCCALAVALTIFAAPIAAETPASSETASLPGADGRQNAASALPRVLSESDATLYREIFALQVPGKWRAADKLVTQLSDPLLMGHVLYQRYMHKTAYRSKYAELKKWTVAYADHPGAMRVYKLALRRQPKGWRAPKRPVSVQMKRYTPQKASPARKVKRLSAAQRRLTRRVTNRVKGLVRRERPTQALKLLNGKSYRSLNAVSYDRNLTIIARGYYHAGLDKKALEIAERAIKRSGANAPYAHWWAGLAAWRLGEHRVAAAHFGDMARIPDLSDWSRSGAAFWAARASLVGRDPARVAGMLEIGAQFTHTFYGLLSLQARDGEVPFDWALPQLGAVELSLLDQVPTVRRALALIEAQQTIRSESELKRLTVAPSPELTRVLLSLIGKANLPDVAIRLGSKLQRTRGERYDAALFPVPGWTPSGGYDIDKALIFAFMRQESRFRVDAKSHRGASGLMQLMPATARFIARKRTSRAALFDPAQNIALGQKYIRHLLEDPTIGSNLFYATTAYNAGPGNLRKWLRKVVHRDDPLLFIESVRSRETRNFVERVLTNFWIYRLRLGQETPSLAAAAAGEWPIYIPMDASSRKVGRAN